MIIKNGFYNVLFLPAIIVIGLLTSYEDIVVSKIRNCRLVLGFLFIGFVYGGAYIVSWHTHTTISFLHGFDKRGIRQHLPICSRTNHGTSRSVQGSRNRHPNRHKVPRYLQKDEKNSHWRHR